MVENIGDKSSEGSAVLGNEYFTPVGTADIIHVRCTLDLWDHDSV